MRIGPGILVAAAGAFLVAAGCGDSSTEPVVPKLPEVPVGTIVFFEDFDDENNGNGVYNWTAFADWTVTDGCVDLHGNGFHDVQRGNGLYVDLDGTCEAGGTLESKEEFVLPSGVYVLEFWLAGNNRIDRPDTVDVSFGTARTEQYVLNRGEPFALKTWRLDVDDEVSGRLRFHNRGGDDHGALLDVVRLRRVE